MVEDNVVQKLDSQGFTRRFQLVGHRNVVFAGDQPSCGMVVGHDDGGGLIGEGFAKEGRVSNLE